MTVPYGMAFYIHPLGKGGSRGKMTAVFRSIVLTWS